MEKDNLFEYLLDLDGIRHLIDEDLGLWVKFDVKTVSTQHRKQGIRYSLSLHNRNNKRIMGFDNSHEIEYGGKQNVAPQKTVDHWHFDENDKGRPYNYESAEKLLHDFWLEVTKKINRLKEIFA